jgi:6-pyruvoyltetrahydropterin/6-carboxytetrahydropterin synthase
MIVVTKIFRFEMAHAILGYNGKCRNIHGHSYELHVTVGAEKHENGFLTPPGFIIDFKDLKKIVNSKVIDEMDHKLVLSKAYVEERCKEAAFDNLVIFPAEPTAENLLIDISNRLHNSLRGGVKLKRLKLYETEDSYAEWLAES